MRAVIRELFETVILALLIFLALHLSIQNFRVQGPSMRPTLEEGEYVIVNKLVYTRFQPKELAKLVPFLDFDVDRLVFPFQSPHRGDVIIFRFPRDQSRDFVKRVVGVPGDRLTVEGRQLFVNGEVLEGTSVSEGNRSNIPDQVPPDTYFVLGDNRRSSLDSRDWGPVPAANIIGRAWISFWPFDRWHTLQAFPEP